MLSIIMYFGYKFFLISITVIRKNSCDDGHGQCNCLLVYVTVADEKTDGKNRKKKKKMSLMVQLWLTRGVKRQLNLLFNIVLRLSQHSSCINVKPGLCHFRMCCLVVGI